MFIGVRKLMSGSCVSCELMLKFVSGSVMMGGRSFVVCCWIEGDGDVAGSDVRSTAACMLNVL